MQKKVSKKNCQKEKKYYLCIVVKDKTSNMRNSGELVLLEKKIGVVHQRSKRTEEQSEFRRRLSPLRLFLLCLYDFVL